MKTMKLNELLKKTTPLPHNVRGGQKLTHIDNTYRDHAANVLPELVKAIKSVKCPAADNPQHETLQCIRCWCSGMMAEALARAEEVRDL